MVWVERCNFKMSKVVVWWCLLCFSWSGEAISSKVKDNIPALRCPPNVNSSQCLYQGHQADEYLFALQGVDVTVKYGAKDFKLSCPKGVNLEDGTLPAFTRPTAVSAVTFSGCTPTTGLVPALTALNISLSTLTYLTFRDLPPFPTETPSLCRSLNLTSLELNAAGRGPTLIADMLQDCTGLVTLRLMGVKIESAALSLLPVSLQQLALRRGSLKELPSSALQRLTTLQRLEIQSDKLRAAPLAAAVNLRAAVIYAPLSDLTVAAALENMTLGGGALVAPNGTCNVRSLRLTGAPENVTTEWIVRCGTLKAVTWYCGAHQTVGRIPLPPAAALQELRMYRCRLDVADGAWLRGASALTNLQLINGASTTLPGDLLVWNVALRSISLRASGVSRESLRALAKAELQHLRELDLSDNPTLGDLCGGGRNVDVNAVSLLVRLRALQVLSLRNTAATHLCSDWRRDLPALNLLDLSNNNISRLQGEDLQWSQANMTVHLCDNPLETVSYTREQYRGALIAQPSRVNLHLCNDDSSAPPLRCDCDVYWFARALRDRPDNAPPALATLRCLGGTLLRDMPYEDLTCPVPAPPCPHTCRCAATGEAVLVSCSRAGLDALPTLPDDLPVRTLDLANNAITQLDTVALPANLTLLDISHNRLQLMNLAEVEAALNASRRLRLAGNPLRCECAAQEALAALIAAAARIEDWSTVRCSDGRLVATMQLGALCARPALTATLVTLLAAIALAVLSLVVFLTSRRARRQIKWFLWLRWRGALFEAEETDAAGARYEAFVSFATSEAGRAAKLAAQLESSGRRLCLHHRDWAPGELITEQIARSVRDSRRTIVLLSDAFLASAWARAEFSAAWALTQRERTPRLLLVLLPELTFPRSTLAAELPADLAVAVATCTYLEWDEPQFWERLERAVPLPPVSVTNLASTDINAPNDVERY